MEALDQTLAERIEEVILAHRGQPLLSTTGSHVALAELVSRTEGLEAAVRELAAEVERLGASSR